MRISSNAALKTGMKEGVALSFDRFAEHLGTMARTKS
jgi:hypothetical protein